MVNVSELRQGLEEERSCPWLLRLGPWIVSHHASPQQTAMKDVKCKNGERLGGGGELYNLKGFHPGNRKDIIF